MLVVLLLFGLFLYMFMLFALMFIFDDANVHVHGLHFDSFLFGHCRCYLSHVDHVLADIC